MLIWRFYAYAVAINVNHLNLFLAQAILNDLVETYSLMLNFIATHVAVIAT